MRTLVTAVSLAALAACGGGAQPAAPAQAAAPAAKTVFSDAPAYASQAVAASAASAHAAKKVAPPGKEAGCLTCHKAGGSATQFLFAGTVYADADGKKGQPDVEIRVADALGNTVTVHSDADGNFWSKGTAPLATPAKAGARDTVKTRTMNQPVDKGDCNNCHNADLPILLTHT